MPIAPYLFLDGRCRDAIDFYVRALGAEVQMLMRFDECPSPDAQPPGVPGDRIMHASLSIGGSQVFLSDGRGGGNPEFHGFSLSYTVADDASARHAFDALAQDGSITMPLTQTFFASSFGMVTDRFGVPWMVITRHSPAS